MQGCCTLSGESGPRHRPDPAAQPAAVPPFRVSRRQPGGACLRSRRRPVCIAATSLVGAASHARHIDRAAGHLRHAERGAVPIPSQRGLSEGSSVPSDPISRRYPCPCQASRKIWFPASACLWVVGPVSSGPHHSSLDAPRRIRRRVPSGATRRRRSLDSLGEGCRSLARALLKRVRQRGG